MSVTDQNWETVEILTKSHMSTKAEKESNIPTPGLKKYPKRTPLALRDKNSNNILNGTAPGRRYSENRKVSTVAAVPTQGNARKSKLSTYTKSIIKIYDDSEFFNLYLNFYRLFQKYSLPPMLRRHEIQVSLGN